MGKGLETYVHEDFEYDKWYHSNSLHADDADTTLVDVRYPEDGVQDDEGCVRHC